MIRPMACPAMFRANIKKIEVARKMRTGQVFVNAAHADFNAPFGGYKQSGNGREWGEIGFDEFLEYKSVLGSEIKN